MSANLLIHLRGQPGPAVKHRHEDRGKAQILVHCVSHSVNGAHELRHALQGVILTLDRQQDFIRRDKCIEGQEAQRRGAIENDVVNGVGLEIFAKGLP